MSHTADPAVPGSTEAQGEGKLHGKLGTRDLVLAALAFAGPLAGTSGYITIIIAYGNGLGAPSAFLVTTAILLFFAVGYGAMTRFVPNPGAFYAYITAGLGRPVGLGSSFLTLLSYIVIGIGFYGFAGLAVQQFVVRLGGPDLPWWLYAVGFWAIVGIFGYLRVDISAKVLGVLLIAEVIAVIVFDAVVMGVGGPEGVSGVSFTFGALTSGQLGLALVFTIALFTGFEAIAIYREETVDPERTISRATVITVCCIGGFYTVTSWAVITGLGATNAVATATADLAGSYFTIAATYLGAVVVDITSVLLLTSILAAHLAIQNVATRYVYSLAKDGILPRALGVAHDRHRSPHRASVTTSAVMFVGTAILILCGLTAEEIYAWFAGGAAFTIMLAMALTSLAILVYFRRHREHRVTLARGTVAPAVAAVGLGIGVILAMINFPVLIGGSQALANSMLAVAYGVFAAGVVTAFVLRRRRPDIYARIGRQEA
jgi:amino acid transporter